MSEPSDINQEVPYTGTVVDSSLPSVWGNLFITKYKGPGPMTDTS